MKKNGVLNGQLSRIIASMGHTDRLAICDCGLPIPAGAVIVDLALSTNIPRLVETVGVVLEELQVEAAILADEIRTHSTPTYEALKVLLEGVEIRWVSHDEFKNTAAANGNTAFVRTGEATPYANVILVSGVTFG